MIRPISVAISTTTTWQVSAVGLSASDEIITLAKNSFAASFLEDREKQKHIDAVERHAEKFRGDPL